MKQGQAPVGLYCTPLHTQLLIVPLKLARLLTHAQHELCLRVQHQRWTPTRKPARHLLHMVHVEARLVPAPPVFGEVVPGVFRVGGDDRTGTWSYLAWASVRELRENATDALEEVHQSPRSSSEKARVDIGHLGRGARSRGSRDGAIR